MQTKPLMIFDGDCDLCHRCVMRCRAMTGDAVEYEPLQAAASRLEIPRAELEAAVHLVEPDGRVTAGMEAIVRALACAGRSWPLRAYESIPGIAAISESAYRFVASRRNVLGRLGRLLGQRDRYRRKT